MFFSHDILFYHKPKIVHIHKRWAMLSNPLHNAGSTVGPATLAYACDSIVLYYAAIDKTCSNDRFVLCF